MAKSDIYNQLKEMFEGIRDERGMHRNTATRIGNAFLSLLEFAEEFGGSGDTEGGDTGGGTGGDGTDCGCCKLKKAIKVGVTVGQLVAGKTTLIKGQTFEEIFRQMLEKVDPGTVSGSLSHGNDVEYGTLKGTITYTATQNASGPLEKATTDDGNNVLANFAGGKWVRDLKTTSGDGDKYIKDSYTYTLAWQFAASADIATVKAGTVKIGVNVKRKWFAGVVSKAPATSAEVRALATSGLYNGSGNYNFKVDKGWKMIAICLPGNVTVKNLETEKKDGNYTEDTDWKKAGNVAVEGANGSQATSYSVYTFGPTPAENDGFTFTFTV